MLWRVFTKQQNSSTERRFFERWRVHLCGIRKQVFSPRWNGWGRRWDIVWLSCHINSHFHSMDPLMAPVLQSDYTQDSAKKLICSAWSQNGQLTDWSNYVDMVVWRSRFFPIPEWTGTNLIQQELQQPFRWQKEELTVIPIKTRFAYQGNILSCFHCKIPTCSYHYDRHFNQSTGSRFTDKLCLSSAADNSPMKGS